MDGYHGRGPVVERGSLGESDGWDVICERIHTGVYVHAIVVPNIVEPRRTTSKTLDDQTESLTSAAP